MATLGILCRIPWRNRIYFYFFRGPSGNRGCRGQSPSKGHGWVVLASPSTPLRFSDLPTALFTFTIVDLGHYFWLPLFGAGHQMACKPMTMGSNYFQSQNKFIIFEIIFSHKITNIFWNFWSTRIQIWLQIWLQKGLAPNCVCLCKISYSFFFHFVLCSVQWMYCM